jgi:hypothetical protein
MVGYIFTGSKMAIHLKGNKKFVILEILEDNLSLGLKEGQYEEIPSMWVIESNEDIALVWYPNPEKFSVAETNKKKLAGADTPVTSREIKANEFFQLTNVKIVGGASTL